MPLKILLYFLFKSNSGLAMSRTFDIIFKYIYIKYMCLIRKANIKSRMQF